MAVETSSRGITGAWKDRQDNFRGGGFAARCNSVSPDWEDLEQPSDISLSALIASTTSI